MPGMSETETASAGQADIDAVLLRATGLVTDVMKDVPDPAHNMVHVLAVVEHVRQALLEEHEMCWNRKAALLLAAVLHEVDDEKLFPNTSGSTNARHILSQVLDGAPFAGAVEDVIEIIDLVSAKKNKNRKAEPGSEWKLIVRDADRAEAVGEVGIARCYGYNTNARMPLFVESTARATDEDELWKIATPERFAAYSTSASMIDHYYDKLLHVACCSSHSPYMKRVFSGRLQVMVDFVLSFGRSGRLDLDYLEALTDKYCRCGMERDHEQDRETVTVKEPLNKKPRQ